jgi:hypothetical protein
MSAGRGCKTWIMRFFSFVSQPPNPAKKSVSKWLNASKSTPDDNIRLEAVEKLDDQAALAYVDIFDPSEKLVA